MWPFFYCRYGFRFSGSTSDVLTVACDIIYRDFNRYGTTRALALDISQTFDRVWHASLLHKLKLDCRLDTWPCFFFFQWACSGCGKSLQEYPVNAGVPEGSILTPTLFLLYVNSLPDDVIFDIAVYADDTSDIFRGFWTYWYLQNKCS